MTTQSTRTHSARCDVDTAVDLSLLTPRRCEVFPHLYGPAGFEPDAGDDPADFCRDA